MSTSVPEKDLWSLKLLGTTQHAQTMFPQSLGVMAGGLPLVLYPPLARLKVLEEQFYNGRKWDYCDSKKHVFQILSHHLS